MATTFMDRVVNKAIGELLIEKGTVTAEQVDEALAFSRMHGVRLGEALIQLHYVTQDALNYALGEQYGVRPMELHPSMIDERLIRRFPMELLQRHGMIPLIEMGNDLVVVVSDPNDTSGLNEMQALVPGSNVSPQLADEDQIQRCLDELAHAMRRPGSVGSFASAYSGGPTDIHVDEEMPPPNDPAFINWLLLQALSRHEVDLILRPIGQECQVAYAGSPVEEVVRFPAEAFPIVRDGLWKHCVTLEHTNGSVGRWQTPVRFEQENYDLLVISSTTAGGQVLKVRTLPHVDHGTAPARVPAAFPSMQPGATTVVLYDDATELEEYLGELFLQYGSRHLVVMSQHATRIAWEGINTLPAGVTNIAAAAEAEGATCVIYDHPVTAAEVLRILRSSLSAPAVVVCAPVVSDASGNFGISPDIDEIRTRLMPELLTLRAGAASRGQLNVTDNGDE